MSARQIINRFGLFSLLIVACTSKSPANAQTAEPKATAPAEDRVVIQREAMRLIDPKRYQVALPLEPVKQVTIAAPFAGRVSAVSQEVGAKVVSGTAVISLENTEQLLLLEQADANLKVALIELRRAKKQQDSDLVELAEARRDAAQAAQKLAKYRLDQTTIRVPFDGEVFRIRVSQGQIVSAGETLCDFGDPSQLQVEIPVDRKTVKEKQELELTVEDLDASGVVEHLLPLDAKFGPLRDLVPSLASASLLVDNKNGRLRPGQLVDVPIIPQHFVSQVPNSALSNIPDGGRRVQVVRNGVIRNVVVKLLGQVGTDISYVSGAFGATDELIVSASKELVDGTQVRPAAVAVKPESGTSGAARSGAAGSTKTPSRIGF